MHLSYQKHNIFLYRYLKAAIFSVFAGVLITSVTIYQLPKKLSVQLENTSGNYILIKENHIYECEENIYFILPIENNDTYQVSVNNSFFMNITGRKYCFRIKDKGKTDEVYKVVFRQVWPQSLTVKKQIFYLKLSSSIYENFNM